MFENGAYGGYNNQFQNYFRYPSQTQQKGNILGVTFVCNIEAAKSCTTPLGSRVILMDTDKPVFYLKETDMTGVSTVTEYEFRKVEPAPEPEYVTRADFDNLANQLKEHYESVIRQIQQPASNSGKSSKLSTAEQGKLFSDWPSDGFHSEH